MRDQRRAVRRWEDSPRVVERAQVVDLVEVLRLPERGDEPVARRDPLVHCTDDRLQVADLVAPAHLVQPVVPHELLRAHGQPGAGGGALHDERRHPPDHLGPGQVRQCRHQLGRDVAGHRPEEPRARRTGGRPPPPGRGSAPSRRRARRAASCRRTAAARPVREAGTSRGCGPSRTSTPVAEAQQDLLHDRRGDLVERLVDPAQHDGARLRHAALLTSVATGVRRGGRPRRHRDRARATRGWSGGGSAASARSPAPRSGTASRTPT